MISIYRYDNITQYFKDFVIQKKKKKKNWSIGLWSKQLGLSNTSSLSRVINGQRRPNKVLIKKLGNYFNFNLNESKFFEALIEINSAHSNFSETLQYLERSKSAAIKETYKKIDLISFAIMKNWYFAAIREMVLLRSFSESIAWIQSLLLQKIEEKNISEALKILLESKFLIRDSENGTLKQADVRIDWGDDISNGISKQNHIEGLKNAEYSLYNTDLEYREFNTICFAMAKQDLKEAKTMLRDFGRQFTDKFEKSDGSADIVYQFQTQLYPLTRMLESSDDI